MPLPNTGMSFTPFDPLPASELDNLVENVEALQDWSAYDLTTPQMQGWYPASGTWTYASFSAPTGTITVPSDATTLYSAGMRIRISQSTGGTKYGIITKVAATLLTVYFGTDYTLNNETISTPKFSIYKSPFGFPLEPPKWTVSATSSSDRSTTSASFASLTDTIGVPIGSWRLYIKAALRISSNATSSESGFVSLSSSGTTETNPNLTLSVNKRSDSASGISTGGGTKSADDYVTVTSATTFTMIGKSTNSATLTVDGSTMTPTVIKAVSTYL